MTILKISRLPPCLEERFTHTKTQYNKESIGWRATLSNQMLEEGTLVFVSIIRFLLASDFRALRNGLELEGKQRRWRHFSPKGKQLKLWLKRHGFGVSVLIVYGEREDRPSF